MTMPVPSPRVNRNNFANEGLLRLRDPLPFIGQHYSITTGTNLAVAWNGTAWEITTATGPSASTTPRSRTSPGRPRA